MYSIWYLLLLTLHGAPFDAFLPRDARSAKRGIAIVSRPSVRPSVCLSVCDVVPWRIGWSSSKLITRIITN